MLKYLAIAMTAILIAGCQTNVAEPTHRWASTNDADRAQYQHDHAKCQSQADISTSRAALDTDSEGFSVYKQCMNSRGYVLTAYNN